MAQNGRLPPSDLAPIQNGRLAVAAAAAWNAMNVEARSKGCELRPTGSKSSYRSYDEQVELYQAYLNGTGNLAAVPGSSNHGWGLAVDVASQEMRSMIDRIGERYGWAKKWSDAPSEWWHIKYREGVWSGSDPGPYGELDRPPQVVYTTIYERGVAVAQIAVMQNKDGRIEVFVLKDDGEVKHKWQKEPNQAFVENWSSLGKP